ncbi:metallophosphoesterase [Aquibacillus rhizosphaerae]|uniref:Metallophosphoesterase n=1 Tax=Aquibacillus rhizosphaerae TaxID=3051431 RepID=A0ABT7L846_9BACI|nr:metallophosphoesterase [Aquibacillus sp. LR5S19]MDL4840775.1 metallophosphoesterase [Aquibacillus sp. LR5S19]
MELLTVVGLLAIGFIGYMYFKAHHDVIDMREININKIPNNKPLKLFFISDTHRRIIKQKTIDKIMEDIDITIIGGDLIEKGVSMKRVKQNIKRLHTLHAPIYFIWGNNDYEVNLIDFKEMLIQQNVIILRNQAEIVRHYHQKINLVGIDCCHMGEPDYELAMSQSIGDVNIFLTHDPSLFFELNEEETNVIDLALSGHTHGGQIRLFGFGFYTRGGNKLHHNTPILISEGYGYTMLPFRLGTKAECHVIRVQ